MGDAGKDRTIGGMITAFRTSEHWAVSLARDLLWVIAVVGGIALALYLICGTWPAIVTIESESMVPHMNVGDLVVVVEKDRFGELMTWNESRSTGYQKFGDYGDVIIYRPNGVKDFWSSVGLLPLSVQHPIIHRAMTWVDAGEPEPSYLNPYRGQVTPSAYIPLKTSSDTTYGYHILYPGNTTPPRNISANAKGIGFPALSAKYFLPDEYVVNGSGYIRYGDAAAHGGYITKGDNNIASDQGYLPASLTTAIEPVKEEWVVGKSLFVIPLVGLLPLHITEVIIIVVVLMVAYEWYLRRRENGERDVATARKPGKKKKK